MQKNKKKMLKSTKFGLKNGFHVAWAETGPLMREMYK